MIVRFGNAAPIFIKTHDASCHESCAVRHPVPVFDSEGNGVLDADGNLTFEEVHLDTKERVQVPPEAGAFYRVTVSDVAVHPETHDLSEWIDRAFTSITHPNGAWNASSDAKPLWVESDWPELERKLAAWYDCPIGEPQGAPTQNASEPTPVQTATEGVVA